MAKRSKTVGWEQQILAAMQAVDNQIAREMQRSPAEREKHGVWKWEPYSRRIERISSQLIGALGSQDASLDSLLVFSQAFVKTLHLFVEDLGEDDLGKVRAEYVREALRGILRDARCADACLTSGEGAQLT